jgi:signal transduction histidine kinase
MAFAESDGAMQVSSNAREHERARFHAARRKVFGEMRRHGGRVKLTLLLPFNLGVLGLLAARGESTTRAVIQAIPTALILLGVMQKSRTRCASEEREAFPLCMAALSYFVAIANTGGLASPLLVTGVGFLLGTSLGDAPRRTVTFGTFMAGFLALAFLSHTPLGELAPPLTPTNAYSTPEYVTIACASLLFVTYGVWKTGDAITLAYERVAFELATRREELCSESEDRTRALEGIAARLAHEVKNPLAAIKGLSAHMARNATDSKSAERLSIVAAEADRLQAIVDGFLSFSRGFDDLKIGTVQPYEVARELALLLETRATEMGLTLEVTGEPGLALQADTRKVRQALLNLVLNAMQASSSGASVTIDVGRREAGNGARIRVIDRGAGMTQDVLERIRKPYFTTREGGSGLGVAVARGLIEQHGGQLRYESAPGRGTVAIVELPASTPTVVAGSPLPNPCRMLRPHEAPPEPTSDAPSPAPLPAPVPAPVIAKS